MVELQKRWTFEAELTADDKNRLRTFVRNEITYYNTLVGAFSSRMRTMPEVIYDTVPAVLAEVGAGSYDLTKLTPSTLPEGLRKAQDPSRPLFEDGRLILSERALLLHSAVAAKAGVHSATRRAMVREMLSAHVRLAQALEQHQGDGLKAPVEVISPHDGRVKRHVQLVRSAVRVTSGRDHIITPYTKAAIGLRGELPEVDWNICVIRERDIGGSWEVEFRRERHDYLLKLTDSPSNRKRTFRHSKPLTPHHQG